jgi:hypothetical protein
MLVGHGDWRCRNFRCSCKSDWRRMHLMMLLLLLVLLLVLLLL